MESYFSLNRKIIIPTNIVYLQTNENWLINWLISTIREISNQLISQY